MINIKEFISIIIPAYNSKDTIEKCLTFIFKSKYKNFEVIVVDDCSTDNLYLTAKKFPCKLIRLKERFGPAKARNVGASKAKGNILVFLDSDCIVGENWLNSIVRNFKEYNIGATAAQYNDSISKSFIAKFAFYELLFRERKFDKFVNTIPSCNFACKKEIFEEINGFSEDFRGASEDLEFSYRLGKITKILWDPSISVTHHSRNKMNEYIKQQFISSRDDVPLFIRQPNLLLEDTFEDKTNYLEVISLGLFLTFVFLSFFMLINQYIILMPLIFTFILNINFMNFIRIKENIIFSIKSIFLVYLRDFVWFMGALVGLFNGMRELFSIKNVKVH
ncbi:glycosyltransferase [Candidatus Woesearchaeota archaeon]|nr:glycosyltransferase [Candidatus Woesearchaeota archaeon]